MIDIVIKGSCVTRESFNYQEDVFDKRMFSVSNYIFQKPIAVIESSKITSISKDIIAQMKLKLFNEESVRDFAIRQVDNSFTKEFYKKPEKNSYFIMDFVDERMNLIEINDSYMEYRKEFIDVLQSNNINFSIEKNNKEMIL